jgi:hypothetical protein
MRESQPQKTPTQQWRLSLPWFYEASELGEDWDIAPFIPIADNELEVNLWCYNPRSLSEG